MKKSLLILIAFLCINLGANAYTYQWNVPYDNHGTVYPNNISGGYYYGGRTPKYAQPNPKYNSSLYKARNKQRHKYKKYYDQHANTK